MASTALANLYEPLTFAAGAAETFTERNAFLNTGVMVPNANLTSQASAGGSIGEMPFIKPVNTATEPNYVNDDPTDFSTPAIVTSGKQIFRLASMHNSWSTMDFAVALGMPDPVAGITAQIGGWWAIQEEKRLINSALGILADNIANDSSDMVVDIYSDVASPATTNIIAGTNILDAMQTAGDHQGMFTSMAMHSVTYTALRKANLIDFIPDARGEVNIPTYMGLRVVVDDSCPVTAGTNSPKYTTVLFSAGAFGFGEGKVAVPSEMERVQSSGNGGGEDIVHSRRSDIIHPAGYQFTSTTVSDESATLAELLLAANWDRVMDRKKVGLAFLTHNN